MIGPCSQETILYSPLTISQVLTSELSSRQAAPVKSFSVADALGMYKVFGPGDEEMELLHVFDVR